MDQEYLQNIAGSSHVDEGLGDRILSRGASAAQRLGAMTGGSFQDLKYKKVNTLFNRFVSRLTGILKDFAEGPHSVANRLEQMRPEVTPQQKQQIAQLRDLYDSIIPSPFQQHQVGQSILNPRPRSALSEILKEGVFTRDMGLNQALQSNNPTNIINAYVNEIKKQYDAFIKDAMKVTGSPKDFVQRVVGGHNKKWADILKKVEGIVNPQVPTTQQPEQSQASSEVPQADAGTVPPVVPPNTDGGESNQEQPLPKANSSEEDFVSIAIQVADALINAVKGDERSDAYFKPKKDGKPGELEPLPSDYGTPASANIHEEETPAIPDDTDTEKDNGEEAPQGDESEFLYNFHSLYNKHPGHSGFVLKVPGKPITFTNRVKNTKTKVDVLWSNDSHTNSIYAKYTPVKETENGEEQTGKGGNVLIFKFTDDQADPRNPQSEKFSIPLLMGQANKTALQILKKVAKTNPKLIEALNARTDALQRALFATTDRKRMEFKPKKAIQLKMKEDGNVYRKDKLVPQDEILAKLNSSNVVESKNWIESLDDIGYFKYHPDMVVPRNKAEAILKLITDEDVPRADAIIAVNAVAKTMDPVDLVTDKIVTLADLYLKEKKKLGGAESPKISGPDVEPQTTKTSSGTGGGSVSIPVSKSASAEPEKISGGASAPASTDKPKPEVAPAKPKPVEIDDNGIIKGIDPKSGQAKTWKVGQMIPKTVAKDIMGDADLKKKFDDLMAKRSAAKKAKGNLEEEFINPFDPTNFL